MNVSHLLNLTATVSRVAYDGPEDEFGDPTQTATTSSYRCWIEQAGASDERTSNEDAQREDFTVYLEPAAAGRLGGSDRVAVGGEVFEVVGPPWNVTNPRSGVLEFVRAHLRRTV